MQIIGIFNPKGGVGKSTATVVFADFFASNLKVRGKMENRDTLVIDLDRQGSVSNALLGKKTANRARANGKSIGQFCLNLTDGQAENVRLFAIPRVLQDAHGRGTRLRELRVIPAEEKAMDAFNRRMNQESSRQTLPRFVRVLRKTLANGGFDTVFIDFSAGVIAEDWLSMAGLGACDGVVIPTEVTALAVDALPHAFRMLERAHGALGSPQAGKPRVLGILPTRANATHGQFKRHYQGLKELAASHGTTVFQEYIPLSPSLATAADDSIGHVFIKKRYDTAYDAVRKANLELARRAGMP